MDKMYGVQFNWYEGTRGASIVWHSIILSHHKTEAGATNRRDMLRQSFKAAGLDNRYEVYVVPMLLEE